MKAQKGLAILPTGEIKKHLLGSDRELVALRQGGLTLIWSQSALVYLSFYLCW